jgi:ubiquinone/menaquinone biosynthesis C-methylase UbiE
VPDDHDEDARSYYDDFSKSYDRSRRTGYHRMIDDLELEALAPYAKGARVLELGCGTGLILERIAPIAGEAIGIDFSEGMARRAKERGLEVRIGHIHALPFDEDRFDLTYAFKVLAHVPQVESAIREAVRVTRPGGLLLLELYNPWSLRYLVKTLAGPRPIGDHRSEADVYTRWDSPRAIPKLLPPNVELVEVYGIRVLTPFAALHRIPWLSAGLVRAERLASRSPLRYFGGFVVVVLRKRG